MQTDCSLSQLAFQAFNGRTVNASFDGSHITSDAGGLLLREIEEGQAFIHRFSQWSYPVSVDRSGLLAGATPQCFSSYPIGHS